MWSASCNAKRTHASHDAWGPRAAGTNLFPLRFARTRSPSLLLYGRVLLSWTLYLRSLPRNPPFNREQASFPFIAMAPKDKKERKKRSALEDVKTREYTIHLHKHVHDVAFKKRAPTAIKAIRAFAKKAMGTSDVRIDSNLNKQLWSRGVKGVPHRIRVQLARKRNDSEDAKEKLYTLVTYVPAELIKSKRGGTCGAPYARGLRLEEGTSDLPAHAWTCMFCCFRRPRPCHHQRGRIKN